VNKDDLHKSVSASAETDPDFARFVGRYDRLADQVDHVPTNGRARRLLSVALMKAYEGDLATANESLAMVEAERVHRLDGARRRQQRQRARAGRGPRLKTRVLRRVLEAEGPDITALRLFEKLEFGDGELIYENTGAEASDRDEVTVSLADNRDAIYLGLLGDTADRTATIRINCQATKPLKPLSDALSNARRKK